MGQGHPVGGGQPGAPYDGFRHRFVERSPTGGGLSADVGDVKEFKDFPDRPIFTRVPMKHREHTLWALAEQERDEAGVDIALEDLNVSVPKRLRDSTT